MVINNEFAVFILTHGRPNKIYTINTLKNGGYTGKIYIIIDNEDKAADQYHILYGDKVIVFNKKEIANEIDEADNFNDRRAIVYARNACFEIAKKLSIKYWIQLDDDYTAFEYRLYNYSNPVKIKNLDKIFDYMLKFYKSIPALSIAMAQGGDFIGGANNATATSPTLKRKCMNSFICTNERPYQFIGRINEDVNTYTKLGSMGGLFFTIPLVTLVQRQTQSNSGGMTNIYLDNGTYIKAFYTIMFSPSCTKISMLESKNTRIHHRINWNNAVPVILDEKFKKI